VEYSRESFAADGAKAVADGFEYSSDNNADWLDKPALLRMLEG
jgi:hypothetical protein